VTSGWILRALTWFVHAENEFGERLSGTEQIAAKQSLEEFVERVVFSGIGKPEGLAFEEPSVDHDRFFLREGAQAFGPVIASKTATFDAAEGQNGVADGGYEIVDRA